MIKSLYIHIPFCNNICTYCDFYKMISNDKTKEIYIDYLIKELEIKEKLLKNLETIYIGGGTPSSIYPKILEKLLNKLSQITDLTILKEFSIEANPNDISDELLLLFSKYSINRVSLGVQSVRQDKLKILGRTHTLTTINNAITLLNEYGFENINVDYMFGLEIDSIESVKDELDVLLKYPIDHISCYSLILEEKTILYHKYLKGEFRELDYDKETEIYYFICDYLEKNGFTQYEISNFYKNNGISYHNLRYWDNEEYEAIGANASSYVDDVRKTNINNLRKYFSGIDCGKLEYLEYSILDTSETIENEIMLGFRKTSGINLIKFKDKFNKDFISLYPFTLDLIEKGLLKIEDDNLFIPKDKLYISNEIILKYLK